MPALCLVNQLSVIVPENPWKNRASSELLYKSNRPHCAECHCLSRHVLAVLKLFTRGITICMSITSRL